MLIEQLYQIYISHPSIQTDTRKLQTGDLYFALKGPNFNGNSFAAQAIEKGAAYAIIDERTAEKNENFILVDDVLQTLQQLALHHRKQLHIPFIAITGSNGKTTTKELVAIVISSKFKTTVTIGNLNNHIGVPLTILSVKKDDEIAVIEMGANHQKEIESYCNYTLPTHGIITNCGKAHLEGFGGVEGVKKGKGELFDFLRANNGTAFIYTDYEYLQTMSAGIKNIYSYGTLNAVVQGIATFSEPYLEVEIKTGISSKTVKTNLVGQYNLPNVLCAIAVGKYFGIKEEIIFNAIENYHPTNSRSQLIEKGSNKIILDAYNANPSSMKPAIENFAKIQSPNKILMLGGMMELGEESIAEHQHIINLINQYHWKNVVLVGGDFSKAKHNFNFFSTSADAGEWLKNSSPVESYILIKGSRSMQMELILDKN